MKALYFFKISPQNTNRPKKAVILDSVYPKSASKKEILLSSLLVGLAAYLFLFIFQPFGTHTIPDLKLLSTLAPYFLIAFLVFYGLNTLLPESAEEWNWRKEIFKIIIGISLCAIAGYFYNTLLVSRVPLRLLNFVYMIFYTFSVAIPICSVYILTRFIYLNARAKEQIPVKKTITDISCNDHKNKIELSGFSVNETDLCFAESTDNYCTFYYSHHSEIRKILLRTTLKSTLQQTCSGKILRCHRSYIVNLDKVENIRGNAQGYKLKLKDTDFEVPVSRKFKEAVHRALNA